MTNNNVLTEAVRSFLTTIDRKHGSIVVFTSPAPVQRSVKLTELLCEKYQTIKNFALERPTAHITYTEISEVLSIPSASARALVGKFQKAGLIKPDLDFRHRENKIIKLFVETIVESTSDLAPVQQSNNNALADQDTYKGALIVKSESQLVPDYSQQSVSWRLANRYKKTFSPLTDPVLSVSEPPILNALLRMDTSQNNAHNVSFAKLLPPASLAKNHYRQNVYSNGKANLSVLLTSDLSRVASIDEIPLIYALINITLHYYLDTLDSHYSLDENVTRIAMTSICACLMLDAKQSKHRKRVDVGMQLIENTKFGLEVESNLNVAERTRQMFRIVGKDKYNYKNKTVLPRAYYLEWDLEVLKELAKAKHYFLLPIEILAVEPWLLLLYLYARKQFSHTSSVQLHNTEMRAELIVPVDVSQSKFAAQIEKLARNYSKVEDMEFIKEGRVFISKTFTFKLVGVQFTFGIYRHHGQLEVNCLMLLKPDEVYYHSLPPLIKQSLTLTNGKLDAQSREELKSRKLSDKFPILHNNATAMPVLSEQLDRFDQNRKDKLKQALGYRNESTTLIEVTQNEDTVDRTDTSKSLEPNNLLEHERSKLLIEPKGVLSYRVRPRKHLLSVHVSPKSKSDHQYDNVQYKIHKYQSNDEYLQVIDSIASLTRRDSDEIRSKLDKGKEGIAYFHLGGNEELLTFEGFECLVRVINEIPNYDGVTISKDQVFNAIIEFVKADQRRKSSTFVDIETLATQLKIHQYHEM